MHFEFNSAPLFVPLLCEYQIWHCARTPKNMIVTFEFDNRLKSGLRGGNLFVLMSLAELKDNVMALPESERHEFAVWLNRLEQNYGDIPGESLAEIAAEVWDQDDRHAPPTHPAR
jgi:hypothetical protein